MGAARLRGPPAALAASMALAVLAAPTTLAAPPAAAVASSPGRSAAEWPAPRWPQPLRAPQGAPNVLLIMTDDVGFGASSTFGGPVPTPTLDALAREGARYNGFNTTAICSPTRASLLTGRYPHNVGMGNATNVAAGYPGYTSVIPKSAGTIARILADRGWGTAMFGKGHITPEWESGPLGPFDRWPTGLGFQYFYGFLGADTSAFAPALVENTRFIEPPGDAAGYHLDADLADHALAWIRVQKSLDPQRPLFIYYAPGSAHAPHHAPREWLQRFRGRFEQGWDAMRVQTFARQKALGIVPPDARLTPRPARLPAWSSLSAERRRLASRLMEAHAAALAHADQQIGRVVEALRAADPAGQTLVIYLQGDNGGSPEGGPGGLMFEQSQINGTSEDPRWQIAHIDEIGSGMLYNTYPAGWGWAMNTPFQWYKRVGSHFGGIRNGLVISWPGHLGEPGSVRSQFHHVSDIAPTILDAVGVEPPAVIDGVAQQRFDGISMRYTFEAPRAPPRRHTQVFEMMENLGLYHDGWMLSSTPIVVPWDLAATPRVPLAARRWELYDLERDFSQSRDLAAREPRRLAALQRLLWEEAERNRILPVHRLDEGREGMPDAAAGRTHFEFHAGETRIPEFAGAPPVAGRSFTLSAAATVPAGGGHGVLAAHGGRFGGYALYFDDGHLAFHYNALTDRRYTVRSTERIGAGAHVLAARFRSDAPRARAGGTLTLSVDGRDVASGRIEATLRRISHTEGFDVGRDTLTPVSEDYTAAGSAFDGELRSVNVDLE